MEMFSKIPVKALLENDEKTTKLDLHNSGCRDTEALVLAECLKVVELFMFLGMFRVFLGYHPLAVTHLFCSFGCSGEQDGQRAKFVEQQSR